MMFEPCPISFSAHALAIAGLLPCVSHVMISSLRPSTPPLALTWLTRSFAAASAGPSNGAIAPLPSNAQPITIGEAAVVRAAAVAATATTVATTTSSTSPRRELGPLILYSFTVSRRASRSDGGLGGLGGKGMVPDARACQLASKASRSSAAVVGRGEAPERVLVRRPERAVVREDLDVVEPVVAGVVEGAEDARHVGDPRAGRGPVGPAAGG